MQQFYKNLSIWLLIALAISLLVHYCQKAPERAHTVTYTEFLHKVDSGLLTNVTVIGNTVLWNSSDGTLTKTVVPQSSDALARLLRGNVTVLAEEPSQPSWLLYALLSWLPFLFFGLLWLFYFRRSGGQSSGGSGRILAFGKSRARLINPEESKIKLDDVAGIDEAKEEVAELVDFLKKPEKFTAAGARIPAGVLLYGEPGTGKTLLAKAIAGEAGVPFFSISGSNFVEMYVGIGASRVRDLFNEGKKRAPCIIFIDEIDAVGRHRSAGGAGSSGNDEREQTLNQLLVEMDGFDANDHVIVIAATNRQDILDPALLRPGRFDRQVMVPLPDVGGREKILKVHARNAKIDPQVNWQVIARGTPGFSGAQLASLVNEAALMTARSNQPAVTTAILEAAKDKVLMGAERRSLIITDREKRITACHEAGHALVAWMLPGADPVHKVTIIPRGRALGLTMQLPEEERVSHDRAYLLATLSTLLGGRVAEEIVFNQTTTGAGNDLERVSDLSRRMVCEWGMSETVGPLTFRVANPLAGQPGQIMSEQTAILIDGEVKKLVQTAYDTARHLLVEHRSSLDAVTAALLERETLSRDELEVIIRTNAPG
ncbi:MAG: ATP-dependent zinc metalloprotease FtsH [Desulfobulbus sp.]|jgi:cell division protease FtsH|uniref:ATP-dependent zinc metalloprotease FtsH n=1 Tax=Desulfobulbus sp. TaxID=895 RepID=UPI002840DFF0|nr:ATP-dependent zinc metalloprotease FtsH [Desulfobulbus sp.]MDR2550784.1 ATP-dependent zinc metalloprotease FtsH [Desulfobulbus sp.]